jgi:hypothetical protein
MGDLRNKIAKQIREEETHRMQAQMRPKGPPFKPKCASCGRLGPFFDKPDGTLGLFYSVMADRAQGNIYCCEDCLGPRAVAMADAIVSALTLGEIGSAIVTITCQSCRVIRLTRANLLTRRRPWASKAKLGEPVDGFACRRCRHRSPVVISPRHYIGPQLHGVFWESYDHRGPNTCACEKASYDAAGLAVVVNEELTEWAIYCSDCLPSKAAKALASQKARGAGLGHAR